jgi:hypothetical protein
VKSVPSVVIPALAAAAQRLRIRGYKSQESPFAYFAYSAVPFPHFESRDSHRFG